MGIGLGASYGSNSSNSSGSSSNTYSAGQTGLQDQLTSLFKTLLPGIGGGSLSPNVTALKTQADDQINQNYSGLGDRVNKYLASRGFAKSGTAGKAALSTELGRSGAIANNSSNFAGQQLNYDQGLLSDALLTAFNAIGATGSSSGSSSGFKIGGGASFGIPGFGGGG